MEGGTKDGCDVWTPLGDELGDGEVGSPLLEVDGLGLVVDTSNLARRLRRI